MWLTSLFVFRPIFHSPRFFSGLIQVYYGMNTWPACQNTYTLAEYPHLAAVVSSFEQILRANNSLQQIDLWR